MAMHMKKTSTIWGIGLIAAGLVVIIIMGVLWGSGVWRPEVGTCLADGIGPADRSQLGARTIDGHFIEQMIPHHEDAIAMAELALVRAQHPELKGLAQNVITTQSAEIEQMRALYREWYGEEVPATGDGALRGRRGAPGGRMMGGPGMPGGMMGPGMMRGGMMRGGMMDSTDLEALEAAADFDKEFIEQMVPHHSMGVMMAQMLLARTDRPELRRLAQDIIEAQTAEIEQMREWYRAWSR
jgi:uncharacterized protein (DUF305 family)